MESGLEITKSQNTDVLFWHVQKAACMNVTWHKQYIDVF